MTQTTEEQKTGRFAKDFTVSDIGGDFSRALVEVKQSLLLNAGMAVEDGRQYLIKYEGTQERLDLRTTWSRSYTGFLSVYLADWKKAKVGDIICPSTYPPDVPRKEGTDFRLHPPSGGWEKYK